MTGTDPAAVIARLVERGETVATAESFTGGLVAARLTDVAGSSAAVRGGVVAYHSDVKADVVGVDAAVLAAGGAVQAQVALELARGARRVLTATWGIGTTGVAGPDPAEGHPVGTAFIAVSGPDTESVREFAFTGTREQVRAAGVDAALGMLEASLTL